MNIELLKGHVPDTILERLPQTCEKFGIDGPKRLSHLLGQCKLESGNFKEVYENLNYSAQGLANTWPKRYAVDPKAKVKVPNEIANSIQRKPETIANLTYANRNGNGDVQSGDGWKFRGRGYIQLTGKSNYTVLGEYLGSVLTANPDLVSTKYPLDSAAFFFKNNNLWVVCDQGIDDITITKVTKVVNGGTIHLTERIKYTKEFYNILTESK